MLHESPELVHRFYQDVSKFGRPEKDGIMGITTTMEVSSLSLICILACPHHSCIMCALYSACLCMYICIYTLYAYWYMSWFLRYHTWKTLDTYYLFGHKEWTTNLWYQSFSLCSWVWSRKGREMFMGVLPLFTSFIF